jgi:hypothetical protein
LRIVVAQRIGPARPESADSPSAGRPTSALPVQRLNNSMSAPFRPDRMLIRRKHVASTAVRSVGYDRVRAVLQVEVTNGSVYDYVGVPPEAYEVFMNAASKGQHYNREIKPNYLECYLVREGELAH